METGSSGVVDKHFSIQLSATSLKVVLFKHVQHLPDSMAYCGDTLLVTDIICIKLIVQYITILLWHCNVQHSQLSSLLTCQFFITKYIPRHTVVNTSEQRMFKHFALFLHIRLSAA